MNALSIASEHALTSTDCTLSFLLLSFSLFPSSPSLFSFLLSPSSIFLLSSSPRLLFSYFPNLLFTIFIFSFSHLISSNSNRHSPLKPSLLRAVKVLEQNAKSGTAITTGEGGRAVPRINGIGGVGSVVKD